MASSQADRQARMKSGYIQQPSISGENIAFVAEDDLWIVDINGGMPRRMSNGLHVANPLFSPEGDCIAFSIGSDVWILSVATAEYRRLTWLGAGETFPVAFTQKTSELIFASRLADAFGRPYLFRVPLQGGEPTQLYGGECDAIAFSPSGVGCCVGRHTIDPILNSRWKGYRGGTHGALWVDAMNSGHLKRLQLEDPNNSGNELNISCLMWCGERLWFAAEPDGSSNLWSVNLEGEDLTKHTFHQHFDVRNAKASTSGVVYTHAGELWLLPVAAAGVEARRIDVEFGPPISHLPRVLDAEDYVEDIALHPDGHVCTCICRGQVFEMGLWEGPAVRLIPNQTSQAITDELPRAIRCHAFAYMHSRRLLTVTDEDMSFPTFTLHPSACTPHADDENPAKAREFINLFMDELGMAAHQMPSPDWMYQRDGQVVDIVSSPVHDAALVVTDRCKLFLLEFVQNDDSTPHPQLDPVAKTEADLKVRARLLDFSEWEEGIHGPCWSPDGEWVAYCRRDARRGASVVLMNLESGEKTVVADSTFENCYPSFDPAGSFLVFMSSRTFAPLEDDVTGDFTFSRGADLPYLILLQSDARNPFQRPALSAKQFADLKEGGKDEDEEENGAEEENSDEDEEKENKSDDGLEPPKKIQIDTEGIQDRIVQFPVKPAHYAQGAWTSEGKFLYLRHLVDPLEPDGEEDEDEEPKYELCSYDFKQIKEAKLMEDVLDFCLSMDLENMLVTSSSDDENKYHVLVAGEKPPEDEGEDDEVDYESAGPESGIFSVKERINLQIVPAQEWAQIFEEICAHSKYSGFDDQIGGLDWDAMCARYRQVVPRLRCRSELTDLCRELLAELGLSHVSLSDSPDEEESPLSVTQGRLGLRASWVELEGGGVYKVEEILKGDVWNPSFSGPLARAGVGITEGTVIVALNRERVCKEKSLDQMLADCAPCEVFITYVPVKDVAAFTELQRTVHKNGGKKGFGLLALREAKAMKEQTPTSKKKKGKKEKEGRKPSSGANVNKKVEEKLAAMLAAMNIDTSNGPIWRTVRVRTVDETVICNASRRDLVEDRGRRVRQEGKGRVGYVHVPDTMHLGYAEFYRYFGRECGREALIVDLRCNDGGYAAELLLRQLRNVPIGWNVPRSGLRRTLTPDLCTSGRLVLLIDERTSSDGEAWAEAFRSQGLGKIVGMRTWGGLISIGGADFELVDGAELTLPCEHYYTRQSGYSIENQGARPDIVVEWPPDAGLGEDPQLKEGIAQALKMLENAEKIEPDIPPFPRTRLHLRADLRRLPSVNIAIPDEDDGELLSQ